jgi:hypothetical protein
MEPSDYLIDQKDKNHDRAGILADGPWLLPPEPMVWMINRFGDLILVSENGMAPTLCRATPNPLPGVHPHRPCRPRSHGSHTAAS